jgi:hypothetical protein
MIAVIVVGRRQVFMLFRDTMWRALLVVQESNF